MRLKTKIKRQQLQKKQVLNFENRPQKKAVREKFTDVLLNTKALSEGLSIR